MKSHNEFGCQGVTNIARHEICNRTLVNHLLDKLTDDSLPMLVKSLLVRVALSTELQPTHRTTSLSLEPLILPLVSSILQMTVEATLVRLDRLAAL